MEAAGCVGLSSRMAQGRGKSGARREPVFDAAAPQVHIAPDDRPIAAASTPPRRRRKRKKSRKRRGGGRKRSLTGLTTRSGKMAKNIKKNLGK